MTSILVVTYNRKQCLKRCLDSLHNQFFHKKYEVIIIDNGSTDQFKDLIREQVYGRIKWLRNPQRLDLATCKSIGLKHASGDRIAFIDDDCVASKDWLSHIENSLESCDFVGGPVLPFPEAKFPFWWGSSFNWLVGINPRPDDKFLPLGSNIAFKKHVLEALEENAKHAPSADLSYLPYAEDNYRVKEALKRKFSLKINQDMIVFHDIPLQRLKIGYLLKRSFREGIAEARWRKDSRYLFSSLMGLFVNPARMLICLDFSRFFRLISNISYILSYMRQSVLFSYRWDDPNKKIKR